MLKEVPLLRRRRVGVDLIKINPLLIPLLRRGRLNINYLIFNYN